jgi:hypothetical protein
MRGRKPINGDRVTPGCWTVIMGLDKVRGQRKVSRRKAARVRLIGLDRLSPVCNKER